jgi:formylmethanofuran dehydrogenase subunit E
MLTLNALLEMSSARHSHLCPRQVLGVRMGMFAAEILGLDLPQQDKRLFSFIETDGCMLDGVCVATGCWVGRRTMRVMDFGKMAVTFIDTYTDQAIRITPHPDVRQIVQQYAPHAENRWHAYLEAYQAMPSEALLVVQPVRLLASMRAIISHEGAKAFCSQCGEEIFNEREVRFGNDILCQSCAGQVYYAPVRNTALVRKVITVVEG